MANIEKNNGTLAFYPPRIVAATEGVISEKVPKPPEVPVQGIPLSLFKPVTNALGLLAGAVTLRIDPIPDDAGAIEEISWWLNGTWMESKEVKDGDRNEEFTFDVFLNDLLDTVTNEILYKVRRTGGNDSPSTPLWAMCSKTLPAGNDVPGTGAHPGLQISLPEKLGNPALIGKDEVAAGVLATYTYSHMKAYDTITLDINGEQFTVKLDPDDVGESFSALIDRTMFEWVGSLDNCPFRYRVRDQLGNFTHNHRWSEAIYANIDLERVFLDMPILRENQDDDSDDPTIVDRDKLNGGPLFIVIVPHVPVYQKGDTVKVTYRSTDPDAEEEYKGTIEERFNTLLPCIIEAPNQLVVLGSQLNVTFQLARLEELIGISKAAKAKVINGVSIPDEKPVIDAIVGIVSGNDIPKGSTTDETSITVKGRASNGQFVDVFDNLTEFKDTVMADPISGIWTLDVSDLKPAPHNILAKAKYGSNPVSDAWDFTVREVQTDIRPVITRVEDSKGELLDNDETEDRCVLLTGKAMKDSEIEVFDRTNTKGKATVNSAGIWTHRVDDLGKGDRIIKATALYGVGLDSNVRYFRVIDVEPDLEFDEGPAYIGGFRHIFANGKGYEPDNPTSGSFLDHPASGGRPPYYYSSNNDEVAHINKDGRVFAYKNGFAEISVTDAAGSSKKFLLNTAGSYVEWIYLGGDLQNQSAPQKALSAGGTLPTTKDYIALHKVYSELPIGSDYLWPLDGWAGYVFWNYVAEITMAGHPYTECSAYALKVS